jgi:hypothetical protein
MLPDAQLIKSIDLAAASCRQARYHLRLYELPLGAGYVVSKLSGPAGKERSSEEWYRPTLALAEKRFTTIVQLKTTRRTGRQYQEVPAERQVSLLSQ